MAEKPVFKKLMQIGLVVKDLDASMKKYWEVSGIGPWSVYSYDGDSLKNLTVRGERKNFAIRVGLAMVGDVQWELIEPLDDISIYAEFLKEHGEGLHHVAMEVDNFKQVISYFQGQGVDVMQQGSGDDGFDFAYLDTNGPLSCITEIYDVPPNWEPAEPESIYPADEDPSK